MPHDGPSFYRAAREMRASGHFRTASDFYQKAVGFDTHLHDAWVEWVDTLVRAKQLDQADAVSARALETHRQVRPIYAARALALGLALCPEEVGPQLRLQYRNQAVGEFLHIAMQPQHTYHGAPINFSLANSGAGLALLGGSGSPDLVIPGNVLFVFVRPGTYQLYLTGDE